MHFTQLTSFIYRNTLYPFVLGGKTVRGVVGAGNQVDARVILPALDQVVRHPRLLDDVLRVVGTSDEVVV